jgi:hypothetical protein
MRIRSGASMSTRGRGREGDCGQQAEVADGDTKIVGKWWWIPGLGQRCGHNKSGTRCGCLICLKWTIINVDDRHLQVAHLPPADASVDT